MATSQTPGRLLMDAMSPTANTSGCPGRLRSGSTAILPARSVSAPVASASMPASGEAWTPAAQMTVPHSTRPFSPSGALGVDPERIDADDAEPHAQLDAHLLELGPGPPRELAAEVGQRLLPPVDQNDPDRGGIDVAEVVPEAAVGELADLPRQLDTGRPCADDDEGHPEPLQRRVAEVLGDLERAVDAAPQLHGVVDRLHAGGDHGELVVAEVRLPGAGGDNEAVVGELVDFAREGGGVHHPPLQVEPGHLGEDDLDVLAPAQGVAQHGRDGAGRQDPGRHLVEQRLEEVVVPLVDERDVEVGPSEQPGSRQAAEPAADHDNAVALRCAHGSSFRREAVASASRVRRRHTPGRSQANRSVRCSPTRMALAMAVSAGFTAPMLGKKLVSTT